MGAQYLLRFDDLCPAMDLARWDRFLPLLERFELKPILAVVPDNRDPDLCAASAVAGHGNNFVGTKCSTAVSFPGSDSFWAQMRGFERDGAAIALHGYQHLCSATGSSLIPIHAISEFAGVDEDIQRRWIGAGLSLLRSHGLDPQVWVAPRHGFDRATLDALWEEGIDVVSDGFARAPYRWAGFTWVPQQLWGPAPRTSGLWTICIHPSTAGDVEVKDLEDFLVRFRAQFTSVDRVLAEWPVHERSLRDRAQQFLAIRRIKLSKTRAWKLASKF